jgi:hypothetical protein
VADRGGNHGDLGVLLAAQVGVQPGRERRVHHQRGDPRRGNRDDGEGQAQPERE